MERDHYTFSELAELIKNLQHKYRQTIIAIDGLGGVGKNTFARGLHGALPHSAIIHTKDFRKIEKERTLDSKSIVSPNVDWDQFDEEIFTALRFNRDVVYYKYNSMKDAVVENAHVASDAVIIVEGEYTLQHRFNSQYDFRIWIDMPDSVRLTRILESSGESDWKKWQDEERIIENNYLEHEKQNLRADLVVNGKNSDFMNGIYTLLTL